MIADSVVIGSGVIGLLVLIALILLFAVAVYVVRRRLPLLPATIFIWYAGLLVLLPTNIGDRVHEYSFAMSYNRFGWSGLLSLFVMLFIEPTRPGWRA